MIATGAALSWALEEAVELGVPLPISGLVHELEKLAGLPDPPPTQALLRKIVWRSAGVAEPVPAPGSERTTAPAG